MSLCPRRDFFPGGVPILLECGDLDLEWDLERLLRLRGERDLDLGDRDLRGDLDDRLRGLDGDECVLLGDIGGESLPRRRSGDLEWCLDRAPPPPRGDAGDDEAIAGPGEELGELKSGGMLREKRILVLPILKVAVGDLLGITGVGPETS